MVDFNEARETVIPFGMHEGKTLDEIAQTDDGLLYLDWLAGGDVYGHLKESILVYLSDPGIKRDLEDLIDE